MTVVWIIVFVVSMIAVVKGADWLLESSEKIALALGLSPFFAGVIIVGMGTSLPELVSAIAAMYKGVPEVVVASAAGSNFTNILLVVGVSALLARGLTVTKNLIDSELPMLAISSMIFLGAVYDGSVSIAEAILLVLAYGVYIYYTFQGEGDETANRFHLFPQTGDGLEAKDYVFLIIGAVMLALGANYLIASLQGISGAFNIPPAVITITALAFGTSLPELVVSVKAALKGKSEVAIGNIFGSCAFNILVVVGLPVLFFQSNLLVSDETLFIGIPAMALATLAFVFSGMSRKIYHWEGAMYVVFYVLVILKLVGIA